MTSPRIRMPSRWKPRCWRRRRRSAYSRGRNQRSAFRSRCVKSIRSSARIDRRLLRSDGVGGSYTSCLLRRCSMNRLLLTSAALVLAGVVSLAGAQDKGKTLTAIGPVLKVSGDTVSVTTSKGPMQFVTTADTRVKVTGGGGKQQAAKEAGQK